MEKAAAKNNAGEKKAAPEVKPNPKVVDKMPPPVVKVVGEPKEKKPRAPKVAKAGTKFSLLKELDKDTKMPLQCKQIVGILSDASDKSLNREDLIAKMIAFPIVTRQPMERILGFYQPRLISGGWVKTEAITKVVTAETEAAEEKK